MKTQVRPETFRKALAVLAAAGALALTPGCLVVAAGAAGAGSVAFVEGKLTATMGNPFERVVRATNLAGEQLRFMEISESRDSQSYELKGRTPEDHRVTIVVTRVSDALTRVEIRVGVLGDKPFSQTILDRINANL